MINLAVDGKIYEDAFSEDDGLGKALKAVESSTKKHIKVLTDLLDKAPQEARASIEHENYL